MRVNIFKRLESSVNSFTLTLDRIMSQINLILNVIESEMNLILMITLLIQMNWMKMLKLVEKIKVKIKDLDIIKIKQDLWEDKETLTYLLECARKIDVSRDAKLIDLKIILHIKSIIQLIKIIRKLLFYIVF